MDAPPAHFYEIGCDWDSATVALLPVSTEPERGSSKSSPAARCVHSLEIGIALLVDVFVRLISAFADFPLQASRHAPSFAPRRALFG